MSGFIDSIILPGAGRQYSGSHSKGLIWLKNNHNNWFPSHFIRKKSRIVILFAHGNGGTLGDFRVIAALYAKYFNASVFSIEFPGYGPAEGEPNEATVNDNFQTGYNFLKDISGYPPGNIILMGYSIGTGPAIKLAADLCNANTPPSAVITIAAFMSVVDIVKDMKGRLFLNHLIANTISNRWNSIENIKSVTCPILLLHGMLDLMIPYDHSKQLYGNCPSNTKVLRLIPGADHSKFQEPTDTIKPAAKFLKDCSNICMKRLVLRKIPHEYYKCPKEIINREAASQFGGCSNIGGCGSKNGDGGLSVVTDAVSGSLQWVLGTFDYLTMNSTAQSANHPVEITDDYEFDDDAHSRTETEISEINEQVIILPTPTKQGDREKFQPPSEHLKQGDREKFLPSSSEPTNVPKYSISEEEIEVSNDERKEIREKELEYLNSVKVTTTLEK